MSELIADYGRCICLPGEGCAENFEDDDPRRCLYCARLDGEMPCPAEVEEPGVCMYCEAAPPQADDIFCGPCRAKVAAGMDKVTDPVELVLSAHWASVITQDDEERTLCRCGQMFVGGPAYHRRHIAIWIYRALGLKGPSPWELGPESGTRHHPDAEALGLLHNDGSGAG